MPKLEEADADVVGARTPAHRHDVDGLRALAVLAILAFHLDVAGFGGGFVGVDIFFVISGYVILRSILPDLESGSFSLADFFIRRMRRILPALLVVLAVTLAVGFVMLSPAELEELAGSAASTVAFGANFFFHDRTDYFAPAAHTRPLLHMWSLGIEEQFYILVPLALAVLMRFRGAAAAWLLILLAVASFAYSVIGTVVVSEEKHTFYMPMARFWEIGVGGCVAVIERRWGTLRKGTDWAAALGLLAIVACVLFLDSASGGQRWVGLAVLGTAFALAAGAPGGTWAAAALASRPMVAIGQISYSIYLVHWPLIVFWRLYAARPLLLHEQALIASLTLAAAAALHMFIETPLRAGARRVGNRPALAGVLMGGAAVAAIGIGIVQADGAAWRLNGLAREALARLHDATAERPRCHNDKERLGTDFTVCRWGPSTGMDFFIWGDSHARELAPELAGMLEEAGGESGVSVGIGGCPPVVGITYTGRTRACSHIVDDVLKVILREKPKLVVIASRWAVLVADEHGPRDSCHGTELLDLENGRAPIAFGEALARTVERVRASGARVLLVGPVPEIEYNVPSTLVRSLNGTGHLPVVKRADFDRRQRPVLDALSTIGAQKGVVVVYPHAALCDDASCAVADGMRALYADDNHLSPFGAQLVSSFIGSAIARAGWEMAGSETGERPVAKE